MATKELKYQKYLDKYKNCPPDNFTKKEITAFRWVHDEISEKDFIPIPLHPDFPPRQLDSTDEICKTYGLSLFKDLPSSVKIYLELYDKYKNQEGKDRLKSEKSKKDVIV